MNKEEISKIADELIEKNNIVMMSTLNQEKIPTICAIIKAKAEGIHTFYFSSNHSSEKVQNILKNPNGSIYFYDAMEYTGLTLTGKFTILEKDPTIIPEGAYPEGLPRNDYIIIKFKADKIKLYYSMSKYMLDVKEL